MPWCLLSPDPTRRERRAAAEPRPRRKPAPQREAGPHHRRRTPTPAPASASPGRSLRHDGRVTPVQRPRLAVREVLLVALVLGVALLLMAARYGPHRDELYFASAGQRLAWGDPDQPILTPFLA